MPPLKIGITGGIGTGKSVVCSIFAALGVPVYDADSQAKHLMVHSDTLRQRITDLFGKQAYSERQLNRVWLANQVFKNKVLLNQLNALVHPAVAKDFSAWCVLNGTAPYIVEEAALMYETGSYKQLDLIVVVDAAVATRVKRVAKRDVHRSKEEVLAIMDKQMPQKEKLDRADFIVHNDESDSLLEQVLELDDKFIKIKKVG